MNWIACGEQCVHQQEGYCTLDQISQLTSQSLSSCGYFKPVELPLKPEKLDIPPLT